MGGRGASSATYAERIYTPTLVMQSSRISINESEVNRILDDAVEEGAINYIKPREHKSLKRDLFAHAALYLDGWRFSVVEEIRNQKNIDILLVDGHYWEIKSPDSAGEGKDSTSFVKKRLQEARHQFREHPKTREKDTRVVFNCRYTPVPDSQIEERIRDEMERQHIIEVVMVLKDGTVKRIRKT